MLGSITLFGILAVLLACSTDQAQIEPLTIGTLFKKHLSVIGRSRWSSFFKIIDLKIHNFVQGAPHLFNQSYYRLDSPYYYHSPGSFFINRSSTAKRGEGGIPDTPPKYIDVTIGPVTTSYRGNWSIAQGNSGSLRLYTPSPARTNGGMMLAGIFDLTWTNKYYNDTKDTDELLTQPRNISAAIYLMNGSYMNSNAYYFVGYGYYYPSLQKGVVKMMIPSLSKQPSFDLNRTLVDEFINNSTRWPSYVTSDADDLGELKFGDNCTFANSSTLARASSCEYYLFFSISNATRPIKGHVYPPDFAAQIRQEGRPIPNNTTSELVPALEYRLYSPTCCVDMQTQSLIYNTAQEMIQAMIYGGVVSAFAILTAILCAHSLTKLVSPIRLSQLTMASIVMQTTIDALLAINGVNYAFDFQSTLGPLLLAAVAFFIICFVIDIQLLMLKQRQMMINGNRGQNPQIGIKIYCIFYLVMLGSMIISSYIPFKFLFYFFLLLSSYWLPQCYHMYKVRSPTPGYTYAHVIFTTLLRIVPIWYFYCYSGNFLGYETVSFYQYLLFAWVFLQLIVILVLMVTHKHRYKTFIERGSHSVYTYTNKLLSQHVLTDFDYVDHVCKQRKDGETPSEFLARLERDAGQSFPFVMSYFKAPHSTISVHSNQASTTVLPSDEEVQLEKEFYEHYCMNPLHTHSSLYSEDMTIANLASCTSYLDSRLSCQKALLEVDTKDPDGALTNCFYMVKLKDVPEYVICSICFDYIVLTEKHINLFSESARKAHELDSHAVKSILENINESGKLSGDEEPIQQKSSADFDRDLWTTPCGHIFHAACLRRWMDETLQCPVDRTSLPLPAY